MWKACIKVAAGVFAGVCVSVAAATPIEVRGDSAEYSADGKRAVFTGNVVLESGGVTVYAAHLVVEVQSDGNRYHASGAPSRVECGDCTAEPLRLFVAEMFFRDDESQTFRLEGGLTLCIGESCATGELAADNAEWRRTAGEIRMRGAPVTGFWTPPDADGPVLLRADEIGYESDSGDIAMRGAASLSRGEDDIRGDSIVFNVKTGAINAAGGDSRVRGVFGADE